MTDVVTSETRERRGARGLGLLFACGGALGLLATMGAGCGGSKAAGDAKVAEGVRSEVIEHEPCDETGNPTEAVDTNGDGKADIRRVTKGGREICRVSDLDRDGKPDMFEYFDAAGQLRRREADYDDNGVVNTIELFEGGKLARRETDTTNTGRLDTWDFFDLSTGKLVKRERDTTGSGRVDQWWTYDASGVTVTRDRNGDGLPDPDATITLDRTGAAVSPAGSAPPAEDAGPTETEAPKEPAPGADVPVADAGARDAGAHP